MEPFEHLERELAEWTGYRPEQVVACASGSSALILAFEALRLPAGSEVLCPDFAMIACARGISTAGLTPVFVDCGPDLNLDPELLPFAGAPSAILAVHTYGRKCRMEDVHEWASAHRIPVVEDMSELHGGRPYPQTDAAAYSFYRNKIICAHDAEGGAVMFRNPEHADLARQLRSLGFTPEHDFRHLPRGGNHRLSNAHAGLIRSCLLHADRLLAARREIEGWYDELCPQEWRMPPRDVVWVYDARVPGLRRKSLASDLGVEYAGPGRWPCYLEDVVRGLNEAGVQARAGFFPLHRQEEYFIHRVIHPPDGELGCITLSGSLATAAANEVFYLPVVPGSTTRQTVSHAFRVLRDLLAVR